MSAPPGPDPLATPGSVTVVPLGPDAPPGTDIAGALDLATGTTVRRLGGLGDFASVSLRGSSARQVEVMLDGVPLNPDGAGVIDLSDLPVSAFSHAEVYRGFAPPALGASAMGGVVNLRTPGEVPDAAGAAVGSWHTGRAWVLTAPRTGPVGWLVGLDHLHSAGDFPYFDDQGTEFNRFDDRTSIREHDAVSRDAGLVRARVGPLTVLEHASAHHQELPGSIPSPAQVADYRAWRNLLVVTGEAGVGSQVRLVPRGWWLARVQRTADPLGEIAVGPSDTRDTYHTVGAELTGRATWGAWFPVALARARVETYAPTAVATGDSDGTRARLAGTLAVAPEVWLLRGRLNLSPVLQAEVFDHHYLGTVPFTDTPVAPELAGTEAWFVPRAGASFRPVEALAVRGTAGWYVRPPDFTELFGQQGSLVGNPELVPERGFAVDVGVHAAPRPLGPLSAELDLAYARVRAHDLVTWVQNSQQTRRAENVGEAYVRSVEGALDLGLAGAVRSSTAFTWTLSRNLDPDPTYANNQLPNLAPVELSQTTGFAVSRVLDVSHTWSWTSATWTDPANVNQLAPRSLHGLALSLRPAPRLPVVRAEVLNLLDVRGMAVPRNPLDPDDEALVIKPLADFAGYPLPGRTVMVAVSWQDRPKDTP